MVLGPARAWSRVVVDGAGRLARDLADDLRVAGVGSVTGGVFALDAELRLTDHRPDLAVLVTGAPCRPGVAAPLLARGIPHLPVTVHELEVVVGPLVLPGRSACLRCLALVGGPGACGTACGSPARPGVSDGDAVVAHPTTAVVDPALHAFARATATMTICAALSEECPPGVTLEVSVPWPRPVQRVWSPHPRCRCGAFDASRYPLGREWTA